MTLPSERTRAVLNTRNFLVDLLDAKKTPRVPVAYRDAAWLLLKHYPNRFDMRVAASTATNVFAPPPKE